MSDAPDFEALRAKRNEKIMDAIREYAEETGHPPAVVACSVHIEDCYCACASGGPCEHKWDGKPYEDGDGCVSATCSRCGETAMSHSMRIGP